MMIGATARIGTIWEQMIEGGMLFEHPHMHDQHGEQMPNPVPSAKPTKVAERVTQLSEGCAGNPEIAEHEVDGSQHDLMRRRDQGTLGIESAGDEIDGAVGGVVALEGIAHERDVMRTAAMYETTIRTSRMTSTGARSAIERGDRNRRGAPTCKALPVTRALTRHRNAPAQAHAHALGNLKRPTSRGSRGCGRAGSRRR